jgi:RNA polymerase sigma factor (sigma-70 family)
MRSSLDSMLSAYARLPVPSREEQLLLGRAIRAWLGWQPSDEDRAKGITEAPPALRRAGQRARQQLVERNMRLVATLARSFSVKDTVAVDVEDLIQEGALGLSRAAELFDPAKGYAFSTYAIWWIRQSMNRLLLTSGSIRIPQKRASSVHRLRQWEEDFVAETGRRPTDAEAMETMKITAAELRTIRQAAAVLRVGSLDALMGGEDCNTWGSTVSAPATGSAAEPSRSERVLDALSPWPDLREVMDRLLHGETHKQISEAMGIPKAAVARLGNQATLLTKRRLAGAGASAPDLQAADPEIERLGALYPDGSSLFSSAP